MKIKIIERGWETFSDVLGGVKFENGVSVDDVPEHLITRIGAVVRTEAVTGGQVGAAQQLIDAKNMTPPEDVRIAPTPPAPVTPEPLPELVSDLVPKDPEVVEVAPELPEVPAPKAHIWTEAELADVADKKGIEGLREIADPMNVRARSIRELMTGILEKQKNVGTW